MTTKFASFLLGLGVSIIGFSQTSLTKVSFINEQVTNVSAFSQNFNYSYSTLNEHKAVINSTITDLSTNPIGYNDIDGSKSATGDTLCVQNNHYGMNNGDILYNAATISTSPTLPILDIAENPTNGDVFAYVSLGGADRYVYHIQDGSTTSIFDFGSLPAISQQLFDDYETITYFENDGEQYLLLTGNFPNGTATPYRYTIFRITGLTHGDDIVDFYQGTTNIKNIAYSKPTGSVGILFFNIESENVVYELTGTAFMGDFNGTLDGNAVYSTPMSSTINDLAVNDLSSPDFRIFAATNDGVYSNDVTLNVEDKELDNPQITLFPNPNKGTFTIKNIGSDALIQIVDINGKEMSYKMFNGTINTDLTNGVYFVKITQHNTVQTLKFIKR